MLGAFGISTRVYTGFAVVLALLSALAIFTFLAMTSVGDTFRDYRATARQTLYVADVVEHVYDARLAAMQYRLKAAPEPAAKLESDIRQTEQILADAGKYYAGDEAAMAGLKALAGQADAYRAAFGEYRALQEQRDEIYARLDENARLARERLSTIMQGTHQSADVEGLYYSAQALQNMNLARVYALTFLVENDAASYAEAEKWLAETAQSLNLLQSSLASMDRRRLAIESAELVDRYSEDFAEIAAVIEARNAVRTEKLDRIGPEMQAAFSAMTEKAVDAQNTLGPQASGMIDNTQKAAIAIGLGALVAGVLMAFVIGRWIASAVSAMANSMSRMAEGNLDIEITGDQHRHELGAMARALKVFQANGREKLRLDAEARAAAERDAAAAREREALQTAVAGVVDKAAAGDFAARVEARYNDDALNAFARQLNSLVEAVATGVGETAKVMAALAQGNLTATMQGEFRGAFAELQRNVNATVKRLSSTVVEIQEVGGSVSTATSQIAEGSQNLSGRAENQAASLEEIAATMEEMSATVKTNAENAYAASNLSSEASSRADKGGAIVAEAVTAMASIEEGSRKIADIVTVIDGFAFQTNLLALNAAVEAARAGEAGKGFAVVASEVRTLAQRSAEAARDIKNLIQESSHQVSDGVRLVEETGTALKEIVEAIRKVSETITEISEASREQSSGVDEITAAITSMDEITQQNSALADESASAAKGLTDQASRLMELMRFFTVNHRAASGVSEWDADAAADSASAARSTFAAE